MTIQNDIIVGILATGGEELVSPSRKARQFRHPAWWLGKGHYLWVGKMGSLRKGKTYTTSYPVSEVVRQEFIKGTGRYISGKEG